MKRKIKITFLITLIVTLINVCSFATNDIKLISMKPVTKTAPMDDYAVMPIVEEDNTIKVQLDGRNLDFTDEKGNVVNPEIINGRTMVPMRKIFETFEAEIKWDGVTRTVVATTDEKEITLTIDNNTAKVKNIETSEEKEIVLDAAPLILNDRTMVPVRFIAESLEKEVGWDSEKRTVIIIDFEKIEKMLEEKWPEFKKIFDVEIEKMESFKADSKITGKLVYTDPANKENNETVKITGTAKMNMDKTKDFEMIFDLKFTGNGKIYESLKEAGQDTLKAGVYMVDGTVYMKAVIDGKEIVEKLGTSEDFTEEFGIPGNMNELMPSFDFESGVKNYADLAEFLKVAIGELNAESYTEIVMGIEMLSPAIKQLFGDEKLKVTSSSNKTTIDFEIDLGEIASGLFNSIESEEPDEIGLMVTQIINSLTFKIKMNEKVVDKKVDSAVVVFDMGIKEPTTNESFEIEINVDMDFKDINKDFEIVAPKLAA